LAAASAEILGETYSKKSPSSSIGTSPHLAISPKDTTYQVLGQSRIQQRHSTRYNHPRIHAQEKHIIDRNCDVLPIEYNLLIVMFVSINNIYVE
jgi:hypothetical protein